MSDVLTFGTIDRMIEDLGARGIDHQRMVMHVDRSSWQALTEEAALLNLRPHDGPNPAPATIHPARNPAGGEWMVYRGLRIEPHREHLTRLTELPGARH